MMQYKDGSYTAEICAWVRATHTRKDQEKIFYDPLASQLIGRQASARIAASLHRGTAAGKLQFTDLRNELFPIPVSRSAWSESEVRLFAAGRTEVQHVILGAGLDTFAWRNSQTTIKTFEVDHPLTQRHKLKRLQKLQWNIDKAVFVPVDFTRDSLKQQLLRYDFDPHKSTVFTILGVTYYLEFETFMHTLEDLAELMQAPTRVLFDFRDDTQDLRSKILADFTASLGEPMAAGYNVARLKQRLSQLHYQGLFHLSPKTIAERYFTQRRDGLEAYNSVHFIKAAL